MTTSDQPLFKEIPLKRLGLLRQRPSAHPGIALVLYKPGSRPVALKAGDQITVGEATFGGYRTAFEVDMRTVHPVRFSCALPSDNPAYKFEAKVEAFAEVDNPVAIVSNQVISASATLEPLMVKALRKTAKQFDIKKIAQAESALNKALETENYKIGLKISQAIVQLELDAEAAEYLRNLVRNEQDTDITIQRTRQQVEVEKAKQELEDALREKEKQAERHELEKMRIRMEFYGPMVQHGQWELLAFQLAQDPLAIDAVASSLRQAHQQEFENQVAALQLLLAEDAIEGWQFEEPAKKVLKQLVDKFFAGSERPELGSGDEADHDEEEESG